jgi:nicotinate-nucleotide pyrophosphorylase (carboxylating)
VQLPSGIAQQVAAALQEDIGSGDVTAALVPARQRVSGQVITREDAVLCGVAWVNETFRQLDPAIKLQWNAQDGELLKAAGRVLSIEGPARPILTGERCALNFLQTLCGTATATRRFVDAVAGTGCAILDTRKTLPGLRQAQKYAVRCGGGQNHRMGLFDQILIKENHIAAAGSISAAIDAARRSAPQVKIEVEVESLAELEEALSAHPDIVMLDDFSLEDMKRGVARNVELGRPAKLEASGGVSLQSVRTIAETGVDYVSIGSITKHLHAIDLSMRLS